MGTGSLTVMIDEETLCEPIEVATMYRHYDGYPTGHGQELADYLVSNTTYNCAGCLFADMIRHFKSNVTNYNYEGEKVFNAEKGRMTPPVIEGDHHCNIYLYPALTRNMGESFSYEVRLMYVHNKPVIIMNCRNNNTNKLLFDGLPKHFDGNAIEKKEEELYEELKA